jgi:hypothetical protein
MMEPTSSWGHRPSVLLAIFACEKVPIVSHNTLLTARLDCAYGGGLKVILRPPLMCPLARKKFVRTVAVWTQIGECVTSAEGPDPYFDYSVTLRRATSCMLLASYKRPNSCELHHHRRLRRDLNKSMKTVLRRLLHQNLERNIHKLCKRLPH